MTEKPPKLVMVLLPSQVQSVRNWSLETANGIGKNALGTPARTAFA